MSLFTSIIAVQVSSQVIGTRVHKYKQISPQNYFLPAIKRLEVVVQFGRSALNTNITRQGDAERNLLKCMTPSFNYFPWHLYFIILYE